MPESSENPDVNVIYCNYRGLELLPKILSSVAAEETIVYGDGSMKGTEYKSHIQNSLCSCKYVHV